MSGKGPPRRHNGRLIPGGGPLNPKGRPRAGTALTEMIREQVDPSELGRIAMDLARGLPVIQDLEWLRKKADAERAGLPAPEIRGVEVVWPTQSDRLRALEFLATWGYQKPAEKHEFTVDRAGAPDYSKLTDEELDLLERAHNKALGVDTDGAIDVSSLAVPDDKLDDE